MVAKKESPHDERGGGKGLLKGQEEGGEGAEDTGKKCGWIGDWGEWRDWDARTEMEGRRLGAGVAEVQKSEEEGRGRE
jgi:hypothetical protein